MYAQLRHSNAKRKSTSNEEWISISQNWYFTLVRMSNFGLPGGWISRYERLFVTHCYYISIIAIKILLIYDKEMSSEFDTTKAKLEENLDAARDILHDISSVSDPNERRQYMSQAKKAIEDCRKNVETLDYIWNRRLDPRDKATYKSELIEMKSNLDTLKKDLERYQQAVQRDTEDEYNDEYGKLESDTREKLLGGVNKLNSQDKQLSGVVKDGYEAQEMIRQGASNIRNQRDHIENAGRNNLKAQTELSKADRTVRMIRFREFWYRLILYLVIISLLAAWICVVIVKIK